MNYDHLFKILPKTHWQWNIEDTKHWLTYIGLDSLKNKFCNHPLIKNIAPSMAVYLPVSTKMTSKDNYK